MVSLTEDQIEHIVKTWEIPAKNIFDSGEFILYKFFEKHPENQLFFKKFKDVPLAELKGKPSFRAHASRIMNRFSATVDCLQIIGGIDEVIDLWHEVGQSHSKHRVPRKSFLDLKVVVLEILTDLCNMTPEQQEAWSTLFDFIYQSCFETLGDN